MGNNTHNIHISMVVPRNREFSQRSNSRKTISPVHPLRYSGPHRLMCSVAWDALSRFLFNIYMLSFRCRKSRWGLEMVVITFLTRQWKFLLWYNGNFIFYTLDIMVDTMCITQGWLLCNVVSHWLGANLESALYHLPAALKQCQMQTRRCFTSLTQSHQEVHTSESLSYFCSSSQNIFDDVIFDSDMSLLIFSMCNSSCLQCHAFAFRHFRAEIYLHREQHSVLQYTDSIQ